jgi:hypothetical protein
VKLWIALLMAFAGGFVAHQSKPIVDSIKAKHGAWGNVANDAIGMIAVAPFGAMIYHDLPELPNGRRYVATHFLSTVAFGSGVVFGYILDGLIGREH